MAGDVIDNTNGERCVVVHPASDERTLYERIMGEKHNNYKREIFTSAGASAAEATLNVETHSDGVVTSGFASQTFGLDGKQYEVRKTFRGDDEFVIGRDGKKQPIAYDSQEYANVHAVSEKLGADYYKLPPCKGKTNEK